MSSMRKINRTEILIRCIIIMACAGMLYSVSVFIKPLATFHGWEVADTALVGSTMLFFWPMGAFIGGNALAKFGAKATTITGSVMFGMGMILTSFVPSSMPWLIYLTYSGLCGFGNGFAYTGATFTAGQWYPDKKGFATGICIAVFGGSSAFLAPLATKVIAVTGINSTLLMFGAAACILAIISGVGLRLPEEGYMVGSVSEAKNEELGINLESYTLTRAAKTKSFWFMEIASAFFPSIYLIMFPLFAVFVTDKGFSPETAALGVSVYAISSLASRFLLGPLQDKIGFKKVYTINWFFTVMSVMFLITGNSLTSIMVGYFCIGFGHGSTTCVYPFASMQIFGSKYAGSIYGAILLGYMVWTQIVPRVSKSLVASTGEYTVSFIMAGILCTIGVLSMWAVKEVPREKIKMENLERQTV